MHIWAFLLPPPCTDIGIFVKKFEMECKFSLSDHFPCTLDANKINNRAPIEPNKTMHESWSMRAAEISLFMYLSFAYWQRISRWWVWPLVLNINLTGSKTLSTVYGKSLDNSQRQHILHANLRFCARVRLTTTGLFYLAIISIVEVRLAKCTLLRAEFIDLQIIYPLRDNNAILSGQNPLVDIRLQFSTPSSANHPVHKRNTVIMIDFLLCCNKSRNYPVQLWRKFQISSPWVVKPLPIILYYAKLS